MMTSRHCQSQVLLHYHLHQLGCLVLLAPSELHPKSQAALLPSLHMPRTLRLSFLSSSLELQLSCCLPCRKSFSFFMCLCSYLLQKKRQTQYHLRLTSAEKPASSITGAISLPRIAKPQFSHMHTSPVSSSSTPLFFQNSAICKKVF